MTMMCMDTVIRAVLFGLVAISLGGVRSLTAEAPTTPKPTLCNVNGWKSYNNSMQICCPGVAIKDLEDDEHPSTHKCCGDQVIKTSEYICCDDDTDTKIAIKRDTTKSNEQCCGKRSFDAKSDVCCGDEVFPKVILENGKTITRSCCNGVLYTKQYEHCSKSRVLPKGQELCGNKTYHVSLSKCCNGVLSGYHQEANENHRCCGTKSYSVSDGNCCRHNGQETLVPEIYGCCGPEKYIKRTQFCCNETVYNRSLGMKCCGPVGAYNSAEQKCCLSRDSVSRSKYYSLTNMVDPQNHGKCCGKGDQVKGYDDRHQKCCGGQLIPNSADCVNDCNGDYMPDTHLCCRSSPDEKHGVQVEKLKPSHSDCCYNRTSHTYTTKESMSEWCPIEGRHSKPVISIEGQDETGEKEMCGMTTILKSTHICCFGEAVLKVSDNSECCRFTAFDSSTHECCHGKVIDKKEWRCCHQPQEKIPFNKTCEHQEKCGGTFIHKRHHLCCEGFDRPTHDQYNRDYKCCGTDIVLKDEYSTHCCKGKKTNPGTEICCDEGPMLKNQTCPKKPSWSDKPGAGVPDKQITPRPQSGHHDFPPRMVMDTCNGQKFDVTAAWCLKDETFLIKDIEPGLCDNTSIAHPPKNTGGKLGSKKFYRFVIMRTAINIRVSKTTRGDEVLQVPTRIVEDMTLHGRTRKNRLGRRLDLLIHMPQGQNVCSSIITKKYHRFILFTTQEPSRGMIMFTVQDKLYMYHGPYVKKLQKELYIDRP